MTDAGAAEPASGRGPGRLRRDLGTLQSYAVLLGILIGAGIFRVTSDAWQLTGPGVILAHALLAVPVLATSVGYMVFLSTPLGRTPGGEYSHIRATFGNDTLAWLGAWLKIVSYIGAMAFLANALADYLLALVPGLDPEIARLPLALGGLVFFYVVHALGVRWFARIQVALCALLGISLVVLIVPGLFALRAENYSPLFTHGVQGFGASLVPLFFAYAGFESLAQTAGEVKDSTTRLPRVFLGGILATAVLFVLMSVVTFGVLPGSALVGSRAPMSDVAAVYLPAAGSLVVTLGALAAIATSINASMLVPSRLAVVLARDGLLPAWLGRVHPRTGTPLISLTLTLLLCALLLASGQVGLALSSAVLALVLLYFLHSLALLLLPRVNPELAASVAVRISLRLRVVAALVSMVSMAGLVAVQVVQDVGTIRSMDLGERLAGSSLTSIELLAGWTLLGFALHKLFPARRDRQPVDQRPASGDSL